jgi:hypothetical protein
MFSGAENHGQRFQLTRYGQLFCQLHSLQRFQHKIPSNILSIVLSLPVLPAKVLSAGLKSRRHRILGRRAVYGTAVQRQRRSTAIQIFLRHQWSCCCPDNAI